MTHAATTGNAPASGACRNDLRIRILSRFEDLEAVRDDWLRLWRSSGSSAVALLPEYVIPYFRYRLPPETEGICVLVLDGEQLIGVFPAVCGRADWLPRLGDRFVPPHEFLSDFVVAEGRAGEIFREVLPALDKAVPGWRRLDLRRIREDSPALALPETPAGGYRTARGGCRYGSYLRTVGSFEEYYQGLSRNFRGNLRKARNKLAQLRDVHADFLAPRELTEADFTTFVELEAAGWKGQKGSAIKYREGWSAFYREFTAGLARAGSLVWNFLRAEGRVIAAQMAIRTGSRLSVFKIAYDENYSHCAPGNMLWAMVLEAAFASDEIQEVDALSDMAWHRDWRMTQRCYYDLRIVPRRLVPTALSFWEENGAQVRSGAKQALGWVPGLRPLVHAVRRRRSGAG